MPAPVSAPMIVPTVAPVPVLARKATSGPPTTRPSGGNTWAAMPSAHSAPTPAPVAAPITEPSATLLPVASLTAGTASACWLITPICDSENPNCFRSLTAAWAWARSWKTPATVVLVRVIAIGTSVASRSVNGARVPRRAIATGYLPATAVPGVGARGTPPPSPTPPSLLGKGAGGLGHRPRRLELFLQPPGGPRYSPVVRPVDAVAPAGPGDYRTTS